MRLVNSPNSSLELLKRSGINEIAKWLLSRFKAFVLLWDTSLLDIE